MDRHPRGPARGIVPVFQSLRACGAAGSVEVVGEVAAEGIAQRDASAEQIEGVRHRGDRPREIEPDELLFC